MASYMTLPRVTAHPVSTGISFRELPLSTLNEVVKTCFHFEAKAAKFGVDVPKSVVFEFSKDVQELLRVLTSREEAMSERVRKLEALYGDWDRIFGRPSAELVAAGITREGNLNTPAAVAKRVVELAASKSALVNTRTSNGSTPEAALIRTLQAELHDAHLALRDSSRIAREQAAHDVLRMRGEADAAVAAERQARFNAERALLVEQQRAADELARAVQEARDEAEQRRHQEVSELQRQASEASGAAADERASLEQQIEGLRRELSRMQGELADEKARNNAEEARLVGERLDVERAMAQRLKRADERLHKTEEAWSLRLKDAEERYARCSSIQRMQGMEAELQFLRARQRELEDVVIALQEALVNGSAMPSSLLPRGKAALPPPIAAAKAGVAVGALRPTPSAVAPASASASAAGSSPVARGHSSKSKGKLGISSSSSRVGAVHHVGAAVAGASVRRELAASKAVVERHLYSSSSHSRSPAGVATPPVPLSSRVKASVDDVMAALPGTATAWVVS